MSEAQTANETVQKPTMTWDFNVSNANDLYASTKKIAIAVADAEHSHNNRKLALAEGCYDFVTGVFTIDVLNELKARIFKGLDRTAIVMPPEVSDFLADHGIKEIHYNSVNPFGSVYEHFQQAARAAHKQLIASESVGDAAGIIEAATSPVSLASEKYRYSTMLMAALDMGDRKVIRMPFSKMMKAYEDFKAKNPHFGTKRPKGTGKQTPLAAETPLAVVGGTDTEAGGGQGDQGEQQDEEDQGDQDTSTTTARTPREPRVAVADGEQVTPSEDEARAKEYVANIASRREAATMRVTNMRKRIADLRAVEAPDSVKAIITEIANDLEAILTQEEEDHTAVMNIVAQYANP